MSNIHELNRVKKNSIVQYSKNQLEAFGTVILSTQFTSVIRITTRIPRSMRITVEYGTQHVPYALTLTTES